MSDEKQGDEKTTEPKPSEIAKAVRQGKMQVPKSKMESEHDRAVEEMRESFKPIPVAPSNQVLVDVTENIASLGRLAQQHFRAGAENNERIQDVSGKWTGVLAALHTAEVKRCEGAGGVKAEDGGVQGMRREYIKARSMGIAWKTTGKAWTRECVLVFKPDAADPKETAKGRFFYRESHAIRAQRERREDKTNVTVREM